MVGGLSLFAVACSDDTTAKPKAEKSVVVAAANEACRADAALLAAVQASYRSRFGTTPPTAAQATDFLTNEVSPALDSTDAAMHRIPLPTNSRADWDKALGALDKQLKQRKDAANADPLSAVAVVPAIDPSATSAVSQLFVAFGATECKTL